MKLKTTKIAIVLGAAAMTLTAGVAVADQVQPADKAITLTDADAKAIEKQMAEITAEFDKMSPKELAELDKLAAEAAAEAAKDSKIGDQEMKPIEISEKDAAAIEKDMAEIAAEFDKLTAEQLAELEKIAGEAAKGAGDQG